MTWFKFTSLPASVWARDSLSLTSHIAVIQGSLNQHRDSHSISLSGISEHCCNTQKNNISRNKIKTHIVYNSSSAILPTRALPSSPCPTPQHSTFSQEKNQSCTAVDKDKLKNQTSLHFLQSLSASTFFISAAMLEEESKRFQDTWCHSPVAGAPAVSAGWVTSYTATPAGKATKENVCVPSRSCTLLEKQKHLNNHHGPNPKKSHPSALLPDCVISVMCLDIIRRLKQEI